MVVAVGRGRGRGRRGVEPHEAGLANVISAYSDEIMTFEPAGDNTATPNTRSHDSSAPGAPEASDSGEAADGSDSEGDRDMNASSSLHYSSSTKWVPGARVSAAARRQWRMCDIVNAVQGSACHWAAPAVLVAAARTPAAFDVHVHAAALALVRPPVSSVVSAHSEPSATAVVVAPLPPRVRLALPSAVAEAEAAVFQLPDGPPTRMRLPDRELATFSVAAVTAAAETVPRTSWRWSLRGTFVQRARALRIMREAYAARRVMDPYCHRAGYPELLMNSTHGWNSTDVEQEQVTRVLQEPGLIAAWCLLTRQRPHRAHEVVTPDVAQPRGVGDAAGTLEARVHSAVPSIKDGAFAPEGLIVLRSSALHPAAIGGASDGPISGPWCVTTSFLDAVPPLELKSVVPAASPARSNRLTA